MTSTQNSTEVDFENMSDSDVLALMQRLDAKVKQAQAEKAVRAVTALHEAITPLVQYVVDFTEYTDYGQNGNVWAGYKLPSTQVVIGDETYTVTCSLTDTKRKAFNAAEKAKKDAEALGIAPVTQSVATAPVSLDKPAK